MAALWQAFITAALLVACLAGYDLWGLQRALVFEREPETTAVQVARHWAGLLNEHPSLPIFWPTLARQARLRRNEWAVKAAGEQVASGVSIPDLATRLQGISRQAPQLAPSIRQVEQASERARHDERWREVYGGAMSLAANDDPEHSLKQLDAFLREFPDTPRRAEVLALARTLKSELTARRDAVERRFVDDLIRGESLPNVSLADLIDRTRQFLAEHPDSPHRSEVEARLDDYVHKLDNSDIERARDYSRRNPTNFATRIERFQEYLKNHQAGGQFISEAIESRDRIFREWDTYSYHQAYDYQLAHPDDLVEIARRLRDYLRDHSDGRFVAVASKYLQWWDKVSVPGEYRVTLRRGQVESSVGKYLAGGAPDLGVVIEVAGVVHGPSSVIRDSRRPIWDYTFARSIVWKVGDPITIRIIDYDWSASEVYTLNSRQGDPLAMRLLSGTVKPAKGGATTLVFSSDFAIPVLKSPE
jgi:hypothetical protein